MHHRIPLMAEIQQASLLCVRPSSRDLQGSRGRKTIIYSYTAKEGARWGLRRGKARAHGARCRPSWWGVRRLFYGKQKPVEGMKQGAGVWFPLCFERIPGCWGRAVGSRSSGDRPGAWTGTRCPGLGHVRTNGNRCLNVGSVLERIQTELNVGSVNLSYKNFTYTVVFKECMLTK